MSISSHAPIKRILVSASFAAALVFSGASVGLAASNPSGTGQPSQSCGSPTASSSPNGFNTAGFANAELVYAGSGTSAGHAQSANAVSQYDVACYQVTQNGH